MTDSDQLLTQPYHEIIVMFCGEPIHYSPISDVILNKQYQFYTQCLTCQHQKKFLIPCYLTSMYNQFIPFKKTSPRLKQELHRILIKKSNERCKKC